VGHLAAAQWWLARRHDVKWNEASRLDVSSTNWTTPADVVFPGTLKAQRLFVSGSEVRPELQLWLTALSFFLLLAFSWLACRWVARIAIAEERWRVVRWLSRINQHELALRAARELPREEA
jgi:hypothetical protein